MGAALTVDLVFSLMKSDNVFVLILIFAIGLISSAFAGFVHFLIAVLLHQILLFTLYLLQSIPGMVNVPTPRMQQQQQPQQVRAFMYLPDSRVLCCRVIWFCEYPPSALFSSQSLLCVSVQGRVRVLCSSDASFVVCRRRLSLLQVFR